MVIWEQAAPLARAAVAASRSCWAIRRTLGLSAAGGCDRIASEEPLIMNRVCLSILACALPLAAQTVRIVQTNAAGDEAHLIDPATNKVVLRIPDLEAAHGTT